MQGTAVTATQTISLEAGKLTIVTNSGREGATPQTAHVHQEVVRVSERAKGPALKGVRAFFVCGWRLTD